jgi:hypothetical protein
MSIFITEFTTPFGIDTQFKNVITGQVNNSQRDRGDWEIRFSLGFKQGEKHSFANFKFNDNTKLYSGDGALQKISDQTIRKNDKLRATFGCKFVNTIRGPGTVLVLKEITNMSL